MSDADKHKAIVHWMDTLKERLDHYEVHRNEFLSDMRLPPRNVKFLREVLLPFCENTLLLDNLARSEGLGYVAPDEKANPPRGRGMNRLTIHFHFWRKVHEAYEGGEVVTTYPELQALVDSERGTIIYPDHFPYLLKEGAPSKNLVEGFNAKQHRYRDECLGDFSDFDIALPNEHTLLSICENHIRNAAKHNAYRFSKHMAKKDGRMEEIAACDLEIHIAVCDDATDHYTCTLYDNVSTVWKGSKDAKPENRAWLADILHRKDRPLLKDDGQPNRENMGMADMKINAHLLRSAKEFDEKDLNEALDIVVFDPQPGKTGSNMVLLRPDAFRVVRLDGKANDKLEDRPVKWVKQKGEERKVEVLEALKDGEYAFGYQFKLTKAKKVAWIGAAAATIAKNDDYKRSGIYGYPTWANYASSLKETLAAYEIAVLEKEVWEGTEKEQEVKKKDESRWQSDRLAQLPFRVLLNSKESCTVPSTFDRRVIVAALNNPTKDDFLLKSLCAWIKVKYGKPLLVRGYLSDPQAPTSPCKWVYPDTEPVIDFELHYKAPTIKQAICDPCDALLWSIDHHGELTNAFSFPQVGVIAGHEYFKFSNCLDRAYSFSGKANPDHDRMVSILRRSAQITNEFMSMVDRFHRRIVIVDERVAEMVAGKENPHPDLKVIPTDLWAALAALNIYVVTGLSICDERSFGYATNTNSSLLLELSGSNGPKFQWNSEDKNIPEGVDLGYLPPLLAKADTLIIHRTHWLKLKDRRLDTGIRAQFGDVVITSGAGKPEGLNDLKYISFATMMGSLRASGASKLGLVQVVDGLTIKPLKQ